MTHSEFHDWLEQHGKVFPHVAAAINALPIDVQRVQFVMWEKTVCVLTREEADAATELMHADKTKRPQAYLDHPAEVRKIGLEARAAAQIAAAHHRLQRYAGGPERGGELSYLCMECYDTGRVMVYAHQTIAEIVAGKRLPHGDGPYDRRRHACEYKQAIPCRCAEGAPLRLQSERLRWGATPGRAYDPDVDCRAYMPRRMPSGVTMDIPGTLRDPTEVQRVLDWAQRYNARQFAQRNPYHGDFAEFSG